MRDNMENKISTVRELALYAAEKYGEKDLKIS